MIVPMKKVHVIMQKKDVVSALSVLGGLGLIHVEHQEELKGYQLNEFREEVEVLSQALAILHPVEREGRQVRHSDWREVVNATLELTAEMDRSREAITKYDTVIKEWERWGDFSPEDIHALQERGIFLRLCRKLSKDTSSPPEGVILRKIFLDSGYDNMAATLKQKN